MSIVDRALSRLGPTPSVSRSGSGSSAELPAPHADLRMVFGARKSRSRWPYALSAGAIPLAVLAVLSLMMEQPELPDREAGAKLDTLSPAQSVTVNVPEVAPSVAHTAATAISANIAGPEPRVTEPAASVGTQTALINASHPEWLSRGWEQADNDQWGLACATWEAGLARLPDSLMVVAGSAYLDARDMASAIRRRPADWPLFAIRESGQRSTRYRAVLLVSTDQLARFQAAASARFGRADLVSVAYLKAQFAMKATDALGAPVPLQRPSPVPSVPVSAAAASALPASSVDATSSPPPQVSVPSAAQAGVAPAQQWEGRALTVRELLKQQSYREVLQGAESLARDYPERWEPWYWMGTAQLALGELGSAEASLERSVRQNAKVASVWIQRAVAAQERSDHVQAIQHLNTASSLAPRLPEVHLNLGFSYDALGRAAEAERAYRAFLMLTEGNATYASQRAFLLDRLPVR